MLSSRTAFVHAFFKNIGWTVSFRIQSAVPTATKNTWEGYCLLRVVGCSCAGKAHVR